MIRLERTKIKKSLLLIIIIFFSFSSYALAQNIQPDKNDSIYKYNALENKIHFPEAENVTIIPEVKIPENNIATDNNIKKLEDVIEKQNISTEKSNNAISEIQNGGSMKTFFIGNKLGTLKYQLVQMEDESLVLNVLVKDAMDVATKTQINNQAEVLKQQQIKVENFLLKQEKKFSLFGWLVNSL